MLTDTEVQLLGRTFSELDWMKPADWQAVAAFNDWRAWIDEGEELRRLLKRRKNRIEVRRDCRAYFGDANVPNINDPEQAMWM